MQKWNVEYLNDIVRSELEGQPDDIKAVFFRIAELIEEHGPSRLPRGYVRPLEGKLWEIRMRGRDTIARAVYVTAVGRRVVVLRVFTKKTQKTPRHEIKLARQRAKEV